MNMESEYASAVEVRSIRPAVDIRETPEGVRLSAEMPGALRETLTVTLEEDVLAIVAEKAAGEEARTAVHREIPRGRYERSFRLSRDLSREGVTADYRQGVLTIFVPVADHTKPRRIEVETN